MGKRVMSWVVGFIILVAFIDSTAAAAEKGKKTGGEPAATESAAEAATEAAAPAANCEGLLVAKGQVLSNLNSHFEEYTIDALLAQNPEENLAYKHPSIVMDVNQKAWHAIRRYPAREILDPTYPVVKHKLYPIFSEGVTEAKGAMIIGQYDAIQRVVDFVRMRATGQGQGNMLMLVGPAGTGKTEFLVILARVLATLSLTEPDYFEYTYEFKDLQKIPELANAVNPDTGQLLVKLLGRSPVTLLQRTPRLLDAVVGITNERVQGMIGMAPRPFAEMDPQTSEIIDKMIKHYRAEWKLKEMTEEDYIKMLRQHVRIVRREADPSKPPALVRYQGKHPDPSQLFVSENPLLKYVYGSSSALSYDYTGTVTRSDGGGFLGDEFYRQEQAFRNTLLEFAQNGIIEAGGAPAIHVDTLPILATNDENVDEAREEAGSKASLDRLMKEPMRQPIHPTLVSGTALWMTAERNVEKMFVMRKLDTGEKSPANMNALYPPPAAKGELGEPDGQYAIYYTPEPGKEILIAPHALQMMGLTVAATRMETDPKALEKHRDLFGNIIKNMNAYMNPKARMEIILRQVQQNPGVVADLHRIKFQLREGEKGITARDAHRWMLKALNIALAEGRTAVTPTVVDKAFREMLTKGEFGDTKHDIVARWRNVHAMVQTDFMLPALTADIQSIVGGDSGLAAKLYEDIKQEVLALNNDENESDWSDEAGERHPIDRKRLAVIQRIYEELNNEQWVLGKIKTFVTNPRGGAVYQPLMRAVEHFLLEQQLSTSAITELLDYIDGKAVSEETRVRGRMAEVGLEKFGYDRQSFREALAFVRDQQAELERRRRRQAQPQQ
jgi:hypothetical protein